MKVNDFYKDLKKTIKENEEMKKAINQYEKGLYTFTDCLEILSTIENRKKEVQQHEL